MRIVAETETVATESKKGAIDEAAVELTGVLECLDGARKELDQLYCEIPAGDEDPIAFSAVVNWLFIVRQGIARAAERVATARKERARLIAAHSHAATPRAPASGVRLKGAGRIERTPKTKKSLHVARAQ